jgi:queuine tRNA-ribosyltransferase
MVLMNSNQFTTTLLKTHSSNRARVLEIQTPHGSFTTPSFMPVGTRAVVNFMTPRDLQESGSQIILGGNTYHMLCNPGMDIIQSAGGMHKFMGWHGPMLTDSGGFQVLSLSKDKKLCRIDETGAHFKLPDKGAWIHMTPEVSLATQKTIGADIIMAFDECTPDVEDKSRIMLAMDRTHRWLKQSIAYHQANPNSVYGLKQALFGIIQGGNNKSFREQSAQIIAESELEGIAIGGETVGFDMPKTVEIIDWVYPYLEKNKPRDTMGVGMNPQDLIDVVASGIDMFDCVAPTRNARHGALYCGEIVFENNWLRFASEHPKARIDIKKSIYAKDENPIMPHCSCSTCQQFSRAYLHFLFKQKSVAFSQLACIHNVHVMQSVCEAMQSCIKNSCYL